MVSRPTNIDDVGFDDGPIFAESRQSLDFANSADENLQESYNFKEANVHMYGFHKYFLHI